MTRKTFVQIIPAMGTGGAEQACADIARALVARGDRAIVFSSGGWRTEALETTGVEHVLFPAQTKNPARIVRNAFWLARFIRTNGVALVHARSRAPAWSAWLACLMTKTAFVTTFHAAYKFSSTTKKKYNAIMARGDRVIAISDFIARYVRENYSVPETRLRIVNRGIDLSLFDPTRIEGTRKEKLRKAWKIDVEEQIVLVPARLSPIKGHALVIDAMKRMAARSLALPLVLIVGDDQGRQQYTESLKSALADAGLVERIRLVGACQDMPAAYTLADLVLVPSRVPEGFGRIAVEAMAMGVPVIASALGASVDTVLDGETGWLAPPEDVGAWEEKICAALSLDQKTRAAMAAKSRAHVATLYDSETTILKTLAVYDEI